ncbi:hypothetical protein P5G51_004300 [Virgibacillus sp. 179-BFC.A HS]|uniref:Uncharacterized protein n=1 Tax=Tigheibacillus jepli TaxID=3035914 RepID=A0ABU5CGQ1_9BACI|nr:hypothetical protein [Virgibacillus sp. 179-BFC.A HS]MDY0404725.1 hypothetical protein [Virgibacillus sp. 179-BFC.A HS]
MTKKLGKEKEQIYQLLIALFRKSPKNVFNRLFEELNLDYTNDTIKDLVCAYRNHPPEIAFFDDVLPCLDMMKKKKSKPGL